MLLMQMDLAEIRLLALVLAYFVPNGIGVNIYAKMAGAGRVFGSC
jgi:hypothetical protein